MDPTVATLACDSYPSLAKPSIQISAAPAYLRLPAPLPEEAPVEAAREALGGLFKIIQVAKECGVTPPEDCRGVERRRGLRR